MTTIFEGIMIFCWGVSWPAAVIKTYRTKSIDGVSIVFLWFVFTGYISGLLFKISEASSSGTINPVIVLYIFNFLLVGIELILYYRYRRRKPETVGIRE
ncbi:PQ-loop repeat-containing protein [bacterium]|nr:PQ-loop repeat-containing protein [bacterium]